MRNNITRAVFMALMCSAAAAPAAYAQNTQANPNNDKQAAQANTAQSEKLAQQGKDCPALRQLMQDNQNQWQPDWRNKANDVVKSGDNGNCSTYYRQGLAALDNGDRNDVATARIVVTQPNPDVTVKQPAPQVSVSQEQPQVTVHQGQPQIIVHQVAPTVHVQMPQPVITIDQPQPNIVVRMPKPDVAVNQAKPQVHVTQQKPQVNVAEGKPQVTVRAAHVDQQPNVQVSQGNPEVTQEQSQGQPQVNVTQQQPQVRYVPAKPKVQIENGGQPKVDFKQTGHMNVQVQSAEANPGQQQADVSQDRNANPQAEGGLLRAPALLQGDAGKAPKGSPRNVTVNDLVNKPVVNVRNQNLGTVQAIVKEKGKYYAELRPNSPLAVGDQPVVLPLDDITVENGHLVMAPMNNRQFTEYTENFQPGGSQPVANGSQVKVDHK